MKKYNTFSSSTSSGTLPQGSREQDDREQEWIDGNKPCPECGSEEGHEVGGFIYDEITCKNCGLIILR